MYASGIKSFGLITKPLLHLIFNFFVGSKMFPVFKGSKQMEVRWGEVGAVGGTWKDLPPPVFEGFLELTRVGARCHEAKSHR